MSAEAETRELRAAADRLGWYHTIDLAPGVTTRGQVDCRDVVARTKLPSRLDGMRALDIGTWDGFWAFELERRGAEVVTIDVPATELLDWPPRARLSVDNDAWQKRLAEVPLGEGFELAREALGSEVHRERISVYDVGEAELGAFDLIFVGSILVHLRDPVAALAALLPLANGPVIVNETFDLVPTLASPRTPRARFAGDGDQVLWWHPNLAGVIQMTRAAGLDLVDRSGIFFIPWGDGYAARPSTRDWLNAMRTARGRELAVTWARGIPHCSLHCTAVR